MKASERFETLRESAVNELEQLVDFMRRRHYELNECLNEWKEEIVSAADNPESEDFSAAVEGYHKIKQIISDERKLWELLQNTEQTIKDFELINSVK